MKYIAAFLYFCTSIIIIPFNIASEVIRKSISIVGDFVKSLYNDFFRSIINDFNSIAVNLYLNFSNTLKGRQVNQIEILFPDQGPILMKLSSIVGRLVSNDYTKNKVNQIEHIGGKYIVKFFLFIIERYIHDKGKMSIFKRAALFIEQLLYTPLFLATLLVYKVGVVAAKLAFNLLRKSFELIGSLKNSLINIFSNMIDIIIEKPISTRDLIFPIHKGKDYDNIHLLTSTKISTSKNAVLYFDDMPILLNNSLSIAIHLYYNSFSLNTSTMLKTAQLLEEIDDIIHYTQIQTSQIINNANHKKDRFMAETIQQRRNSFYSFIENIFTKIQNIFIYLNLYHNPQQALNRNIPIERFKEEIKEELKNTSIALAEDLATAGLVMKDVSADEQNDFYRRIRIESGRLLLQNDHID